MARMNYNRPMFQKIDARKKGPSPVDPDYSKARVPPPKYFIAKYPGTCAKCKKKFAKGARLRYNLFEKVIHDKCPFSS